MTDYWWLGADFPRMNDLNNPANYALNAGAAPGEPAQSLPQVGDRVFLDTAWSLEFPGTGTSLASWTIILGTLVGGTYSGPITALGGIYGGTFLGTVDITGTIDGGTFYAAVSETGDMVANAQFHGPLAMNDAELFTSAQVHHSLSLDGGATWLIGPEHPDYGPNTASGGMRQIGAGSGVQF